MTVTTMDISCLHDVPSRRTRLKDRLGVEAASSPHQIIIANLPGGTPPYVFLHVRGLDKT